jgi:hypothetical protein
LTAQGADWCALNIYWLLRWSARCEPVLRLIRNSNELRQRRHDCPKEIIQSNPSLAVFFDEVFHSLARVEKISGKITPIQLYPLIRGQLVQSMITEVDHQSVVTASYCPVASVKRAFS